MTFERFRIKLDNLSEQTRACNSEQIEMQAQMLAEELELYAQPIQPTYKTGTRSMPALVINHGAEVFREIARHIRQAERHSEQPDIAAKDVEQAMKILADSSL